jgi:hypothetical protein
MGDGIEELIGNEDHRAGRNRIEAGMPVDRLARCGKGLALRLRKERT